MPSSYSPSLRIELVADNEQSGVWGQTTNRNFSQVIEEALTGTAEVDVTAADVTLTAVNGATDQARRPFIRIIGTPVVARQVNVPDVNKNYLVQNTTGQTVTVKPTGQTGVAVLPGQSAFVRTRAGASSQGIEFVATVGGNLALPGTLSVAGPITVTWNTPGQFRARSGAADKSAWFDAGRTAAEMFVGVAGVPGALTAGDVAGDTSLRAEQRLWLGVAGTGYIKMDVTDGIVSRMPHLFGGAAGAGGTVPGVTLGLTSGFPFQRFTYPAAPVDQKYWDFYSNADTLVHRIVNDAYSTATSWLEVKRSGAALTTVTFNGRMGVGAAAPVGSAFYAVGGAVNVSNDSGFRFTNTALTAGGTLSAVAGVGTRLSSDGNSVALNVAGGDRLVVGGSLITATYPLYISNVGNENIRMLNDGAYISFYNTAGTTRNGYIQNNTAGNMILAKETAGNIEFVAGGAARFTIAADGRLFGTALHNNGAGLAGATQFIGSGTYTPTLTNYSNFTTAPNVYVANYIRVGNVVHVTGSINIGAATAGVQAVVHVSLPITTTASTSAAGVATFRTAAAGTSFAIDGGFTDRVVILGVPPATGAGILNYAFQYVVA